MNPLVLYLVFAGVAIAFSISAMITARPVMRSCPGCDADVRMDAPSCRSCGYRFA